MSRRRALVLGTAALLLVPWPDATAQSPRFCPRPDAPPPAPARTGSTAGPAPGQATAPGRPGPATGLATRTEQAEADYAQWLAQQVGL